MAAYVVTLAGASFYAVFAPLSWALNADILQLTSWPAVMYHFLCARRTDRWLHWILLGCWAAFAALTKYNAVVLFAAMAVAGIAVPAFRSCLRRPGLYVALAIGGLLLAPHALAAFKFGSTIAYGTDHFTGAGAPEATGRRLLWLVVGYLPLLLPGAIVVAIAVARRMIVVRLPRFVENSDEVKFIVVVNAVMFVLLFALIALLGLEYIARYGAPFAELAVLALAPLLRWNESRRELCERQTVQSLGAIYAGLAVVVAVVYLFFASTAGCRNRPPRPPG